MKVSTSSTTEGDVLARLRELQSGDLPVHGGRTLAYVYDSGRPDVDRVGREAVASYAGSNGLDPTSFPSLLTMENELVGFACNLLDAPDGAVGAVTSGGTESCLLAVQTAREAQREISAPSMVVADTVHAAFHKAAHYFGIQTRVIPTGPDFRADAEAMIAAMDGTTVLIVGSAPSYAHGVVDPIPALAAAAAERGVRCHVGACIGGWVLPYAARLGREIPPWTFAIEGVTSISVDTHKYGYAPKGTSVLLHRTSALRKPSYFAFADWPGYTMLNSTMQSTKSGGPLAGAWAVLQCLGDEGYLELCRTTFDAVDRIVAGVDELPALSVLVVPDSSLITLITDGSCDVFTIADEMATRGWFVQPQMSYGGAPPNLHLSVSAGTAAHVGEMLSALTASVEAAQVDGPVRVDPDVVAFIEALDPAALTDDDFDGLLAASGLVSGDPAGNPAGDPSSGLDLPDRMADINALLDAAAPRMREALLIAFMDRLARPTR